MASDTPNQFGARLRAARLKAGLTQQELADRVEDRLNQRFPRGNGFSNSYLSKIEHGHMPPPSLDALEALAAELGLDADELVLAAGKLPTGLTALILGSPGARAFVLEILAHPPTEREWEVLFGLTPHVWKEHKA